VNQIRDINGFSKQLFNQIFNEYDSFFLEVIFVSVVLVQILWLRLLQCQDKVLHPGCRSELRFKSQLSVVAVCCPSPQFLSFSHFSVSLPPG